MSPPSRSTQPSQGCSCGQCPGRWLSPRMSYQLQRQADFALAGMYANPKERTFDLNVDPAVVNMLMCSDYLPPSVFRQTLHPSFYGGYTAVFRSALDILQRAPASPLTEDAVKARVLANYPQVVERFFAQGGRVVLDAITGMAQDAESDGEFDKSDETFVALPQCNNDYDFALVRMKAGLAANKGWGPY